MWRVSLSCGISFFWLAFEAWCGPTKGLTTPRLNAWSEAGPPRLQRLCCRLFVGVPITLQAVHTLCASFFFVLEWLEPESAPDEKVERRYPYITILEVKGASHQSHKRSGVKNYDKDVSLSKYASLLTWPDAEPSRKLEQTVRRSGTHIQCSSSGWPAGWEWVGFFICQGVVIAYCCPSPAASTGHCSCILTWKKIHPIILSSACKWIACAITTASSRQAGSIPCIVSRIFQKLHSKNLERYNLSVQQNPHYLQSFGNPLNCNLPAMQEYSAFSPADGPCKLWGRFLVLARWRLWVLFCRAKRCKRMSMSQASKPIKAPGVPPFSGGTYSPKGKSSCIAESCSTRGHCTMICVEGLTGSSTYCSACSFGRRVVDLYVFHVMNSHSFQTRNKQEKSYLQGERTEAEWAFTTSLCPLHNALEMKLVPAKSTQLFCRVGIRLPGCFGGCLHMRAIAHIWVLGEVKLQEQNQTIYPQTVAFPGSSSVNASRHILQTSSSTVIWGIALRNGSRLCRSLGPAAVSSSSALGLAAPDLSDFAESSSKANISIPTACAIRRGWVEAVAAIKILAFTIYDELEVLTPWTRVKSRAKRASAIHIKWMSIFWPSPRTV